MEVAVVKGNLFERMIARLLGSFGYVVSKKRETYDTYARLLRTANILPGTPKRGSYLLRNFARNNEWVAGAIARRQHTLGRATWNIVRIDDPKAPPNPAVVKGVRDLFKTVNPKRESFRSLLDQVVRDLLILDAGCIEKERNAGGGIAALWAVDGASIAVNPKWDWNKPATPRYFQYENYRKIAELANDQLIYMMMNPSTDSPIGWSPVEMLVRIIEAELFGEQYDKAMLQQAPPGTIIDLGPKATRTQVARFEEQYLSEIAGNKEMMVIGGGGPNEDGSSGARILTPGFSPREAQRQEYRKWLAGKIAFCFEMDLTAFNLTESTNRSTAQVTGARTDEGLVSLAGCVSEFIEREIVWEFDENHGFEFTDIVTRDELAQSKIDSAYLDRAVLTINEIRTREGKEKVAWGDAPFSMQAGGAVGTSEDEPDGTTPPREPNNPDDVAGEEEGGSGKGLRPFGARARGIKSIAQTRSGSLRYLAS